MCIVKTKPESGKMYKKNCQFTYGNISSKWPYKHGVISEFTQKLWSRYFRVAEQEKNDSSKPIKTVKTWRCVVEPAILNQASQSFNRFCFGMNQSKRKNIDPHEMSFYFIFSIKRMTLQSFHREYFCGILGNFIL